MYVKTNYEYIAISKSKEYYTTYKETDLLKCKESKNFVICPEVQALNPRSLKPICETHLFHEPIEMPKNCDIRYFELSTFIFYKIKNTNEWLYVTKVETIYKTCNNTKESLTHHIEGVGIFYLNNTCKGYSSRDILIPTRDT